jgi:hypothetical protein
VQRLPPTMQPLGSLLLTACVACNACGETFSRTAQALPGVSATTGAANAESVETISFVLADERLPSGRLTLSNGVVVARSDWPALVFAKFGETSCTGALIGPNIVLTAAHCVENERGKLREAVLTRFGKHYPMLCEQHPAYARRPLADDASKPRGAEDYALCIVDYRGDVPKVITDMRVEVLDTENKLTRRGRVLLTGYGCIDVRLVNRKVVSTASANTLRIGDASIARAPARQWSDGAYVLIDSRGKSTPALCPGDSGGPMFVGASEIEQTGARRIVGVNSAIAPGATGRVDHIVSKIAATGTNAFRRWVLDWQLRNANQAQIICGITRDAGRFPCRS